MQKIRNILSQYTPLRVLRSFAISLINQHHLNVFSFFHSLVWFMKDYKLYRQQTISQSFELSSKYIYPCLTDKTLYTPVEPTYFFQDTWCAEKIFQTKPQHHYDVGSSVKTMGLISQFVPTTMVDIRPIDLQLDNFFFKEGSVLELPFNDQSIVSLSSLCVIEHIGLGRYGDLIDPWGSEKAANELKRVLAPGGNLFVSVPVDQICRIYFNAHRAFTRNYILQTFEAMELIEERYIYGNQLHNTYEKARGFGTGLFYFRKPLI